MKSTGVIRRIDELGRIVIPKEIRKNLRIKNGESLEIFLDGDTILLKKYSQIESLKNVSIDYVEAFNQIIKHNIIVTDIYAARETDTLGISSEDLQKRIQELGTPCEYFPTFDEIENYLLSNCQEGDLLITMGAGDVVNIGEHLLGK